MNNSEITALPIDKPHCPHCGGALPQETPPLSTMTCLACGKEIMVPGKLGQYKLERLIGRGGMGAVYEGLDEGLNRKVAVKVILKEKAAEDPTFIENFKSEAQAAAKLNDENLVIVYAFGEFEAQPFLAMELVQPDSLDRMMSQGPVMPARVLDIGCQIAQGLKAASEAGLVHGDVKPENILINEKKVSKLADFGIAALMSASAASKNEVWGTPYYIAPETLRKQKVDFRADMYSLGATLYHAIASVPPFEGEDAAAVMRARLQGPAIDLKQVVPSCPDGIAKIIMRMLEAEPSRRFPNYDALIKEMKKELAAVKSSIGGGKRIMLKGKTAPVTPINDPSRPMPSVLNPNAPLVEKKKGLSKNAIIGIAAGGGVGLLLLILLPILLLSGSDETTATSNTSTPTAVVPTVIPGEAERAELTTLSDAMAKRAVTAKNTAAEAEKIVKRLASRAKRAVFSEHASFLEPSTEEAPTELLKTLQKSFALSAALATEATSLDTLRKQIDAALSADDPVAALAEVQAAIAAYEKSPEAAAAKGALATLKRTQSGWNKVVDRGREEMEKEAERRRVEQQKADAAAKEAAEKAKLQDAIATEVSSVDAMFADTTDNVNRFNLEAALATFKQRSANLKYDEAKTKAKEMTERLEIYLRLKQWMIAEAKAGNLATFGITNATVDDLTFKGKSVKWNAFIGNKNAQKILVQLINSKLVDDQGAKTLAVSKRAELSVSAVFVINYYLGEEMISKSVTLQGIREKLRNQADNLPLTRDELALIDVADASEPSDDAAEGESETSEE